MSECERLSTCPFYAEYNEKRALNSVLAKYIDNYCKGEKKTECVRMKIAVKFGPDKVPRNMAPPGVPILGTTRDGWSDEALHPPL